METKTFDNKHILITGANGFIGRHLIKALFSKGSKISVLDKYASNLPTRVDTYTGDLRDKEFVEKCITKSNPDIVIHLAAFKERSTQIEDFIKAVEINLMGSLNLFRAVKSLNQLQTIVVVGTAEEYGRNLCPFSEGMREAPVSAYSFSKLCMTHLAEVLYSLYKMPFVMIRPTLAYGPEQGMEMFLPALINSLIQDKPFKMTLGQQTRDYIYISDLIDALLNAAQTMAVGEIINIGSGTPITIADLALKVENMLNKSGLVQLGGRDYRTGEIMEYYVNNNKAQQILNWQPRINLEEGLRHTINYYLKGDSA